MGVCQSKLMVLDVLSITGHKRLSIESELNELNKQNVEVGTEDDVTNSGGNGTSGNGGKTPCYTDGNMRDYHERYHEMQVLGKGQFGIVKLISTTNDGKKKKKGWFGGGGNGNGKSKKENTNKNVDSEKNDLDKSNKTLATAKNDDNFSQGDNSDDALACKILPKGVSFRDNTFYSPISADALKSEVQMLRQLGKDSSTLLKKKRKKNKNRKSKSSLDGIMKFDDNDDDAGGCIDNNYFCIKLFGVYESITAVHLVMECCTGGEMMEYVANLCTKDEMTGKEIHVDLTIEDLSRICYQLFSALKHCEK